MSEKEGAENFLALVVGIMAAVGSVALLVVAWVTSALLGALATAVVGLVWMLVARSTWLKER